MRGDSSSPTRPHAGGKLTKRLVSPYGGPHHIKCRHDLVMSCFACTTGLVNAVTCESVHVRYALCRGLGPGVMLYTFTTGPPSHFKSSWLQFISATQQIDRKEEAQYTVYSIQQVWSRRKEKVQFLM